MNIQQFQEALFTKGREIGYADMEIYYVNGRSTSVKVLKGEIDQYTIVENGGLSFRGVINGKMGYASTEKLEPDVIDFLLEEARSNADILESEEQDELFESSESYPEQPAYASALADTVPEILIEAALEMERTALAADPRIVMARHCSVSIRENEVLIVNTKGLHCHRRKSLATAYVYVIATEHNETVTGGWHDYSLRSVEDIDVADVAHRAVQEAVSRLGAHTIQSDNYPVIFRHDAAAQLLAAYTSVFSAESVDKGFSRLAGKLGQKVASEHITLMDDPLMKNVPAGSTFDAEGSATRRNEIIKDGELRTYFHNRKTARKAGVQSTSNASKGSYNGKIGVSYHNLYVEPGTSALEDMIRRMDRGLMIVELQGLHAGTNTASGNFSLACLGYWIEQGQVVSAVNQITVSGNFFDVLQQVEEVGNDLRFTGSCTSPSLKLASLSISGS
uniref:PmbA protein n=1 Tax=Paenibacillus brasilensis TaxID=128574 RepID=A0A3S7QFY4_9BACL|nr:PmbA protein [Paenibacillus brasilensis]